MSSLGRLRQHDSDGFMVLGLAGHPPPNLESTDANERDRQRTSRQFVE
jgi:hypothetical protein